MFGREKLLGLQNCQQWKTDRDSFVFQDKVSTAPEGAEKGPEKKKKNIHEKAHKDEELLRIKVEKDFAKRLSQKRLDELKTGVESKKGEDRSAEIQKYMTALYESVLNIGEELAKNRIEKGTKEDRNKLVATRDKYYELQKNFSTLDADLRKVNERLDENERIFKAEKDENNKTKLDEERNQLLADRENLYKLQQQYEKEYNTIPSRVRVLERKLTKETQWAITQLENANMSLVKEIRKLRNEYREKPMQELYWNDFYELDKKILQLEAELDENAYRMAFLKHPDMPSRMELGKEASSGGDSLSDKYITGLDTFLISEREVEPIQDLELKGKDHLTRFLLLHLSNKEGKKWIASNIGLGEPGDKSLNRTLTVNHIKDYFEQDNDHGFYIKNDQFYINDSFVGDKSIDGPLSGNGTDITLARLVEGLKGYFKEENETRQIDMLIDLSLKENPQADFIKTIRDREGWVDLFALKGTKGFENMLERAKYTCGIDNAGLYKFMHAEKNGKPIMYALLKGQRDIPYVYKYDIREGKLDNRKLANAEDFDIIAKQIGARVEKEEKIDTEEAKEYNLALEYVKSAKSLDDLKKLDETVFLSFTDQIEVDKITIKKSELDQLPKKLSAIYTMKLRKSPFEKDITNVDFRKYIINKGAESRAAEIIKELQMEDKFKELDDSINITIKSEKGDYSVSLGKEALAAVKSLWDKAKKDALDKANLDEVNKAMKSKLGQAIAALVGPEEFSKMVSGGTFGMIIAFMGFLGKETYEKIEGAIGSIMEKFNPSGDKEKMSEAFVKAFETPSDEEKSVDTMSIPGTHRYLIPASPKVAAIKYKPKGIFSMMSEAIALDPDKTVTVNGKKYCEVPPNTTIQSCTIPKGSFGDPIEKKA